MEFIPCYKGTIRKNLHLLIMFGERRTLCRNGMTNRVRSVAKPFMYMRTGTMPPSIVRAAKPRIVRNGMRYRARNAAPLSTRDANGSIPQSTVHDARLLTHRETNPVVTVALHSQSQQELRYNA